MLGLPVAVAEEAKGEKEETKVEQAEDAAEKDLQPEAKRQRI